MGKSPAIILINPQIGENIGAAARAMLNFGLDDLRLVAPRDGWPSEIAYQVASEGSKILDAAKLFETAREAVADLHLVIASTARDRRMTKEVVEPAEAMERMKAAQALGQKCGLMFGAERTGITNEDVVLSDAIVTIPTAQDFASINLAQSVVILAHAWFSATNKTKTCHAELVSASTLQSDSECEEAWALKRVQGDKVKGRGTTGPRATPVNKEVSIASQAEVQGMLDHLLAELDKNDFWKEPKKKKIMWQNLQNIFTRGRLSEQEVRTLRGVFRCLVEGR